LSLTMPWLIDWKAGGEENTSVMIGMRRSSTPDTVLSSFGCVRDSICGELVSSRIRLGASKGSDRRRRESWKRIIIKKNMLKSSGIPGNLLLLRCLSALSPSPRLMAKAKKLTVPFCNLAQDIFSMLCASMWGPQHVYQYEIERDESPEPNRMVA